MLGEIAFLEIFHCNIHSLVILEPSQELHKQWRILKQLSIRTQQNNPVEVASWEESLKSENTNLCQFGHHKELPRIIESEGPPLINRLYRTVAACSFLDLLIDNTKTSPPEFPAIAPILLHFPIPIFSFLHISRVPNVIMKEFGFEFIPPNQIGLRLIHVSNLRVPDPKNTPNELKKWKCRARKQPLARGWSEDWWIKRRVENSAEKLLKFTYPSHMPKNPPTTTTIYTEPLHYHVSK